MKAIRIGNHIIWEAQICSVEYKKFSEEDAKLIGYKSTLMIYTTDARVISFINEDADRVWKWANGRAVNLSVLKP